MTLTRPLPARLMIATLLASTALSAQAEITPDTLWQRWQDKVAESGRSITAERTTSEAGGLRLHGVEVSQTLADGTVSVRLDQMLLRPAEGDSVAVVIEAGQVLHLDADATDGDEEDIAARFDLGGEGLTLAVTGEISAPDYAFASEAFELALTSLTQGGTALEASGLLGLEGLSGTIEGTDPSAGAPLEASFATTAARMEMNITDPATNTVARSTASQEDLAAEVTFDPGKDGANWSVSGMMSGGAATNSSVQSGPEIGTLETSGTQDKVALNFAVAPERASYDAKIEGATFSVASDQFPIPPVSFTLPEGIVAVSIPLSPSDDAQTARIGLRLSDFTVDDMLWNMLDPGRALPRTPAQLELDLEADLMISEASKAPPVPQAGPGTPMPIPMPGLIPTALRINSLKLGFAEADLDATGSFLVETRGTPPVPDLSQPVGSLDIAANGIMTLLQRLSAANLIDPQEAMGAQMMLGMFATQGEGDSLTSRIVAEPGGGLVVNGNRMR